ncbi:oxidative stress defense protein [Vibrio sp.]|uniref:Oxidative stress defense protein n=1 Tax=Vibrio viridaestus TaxID=2487322 RepID=A0A3N9TF66_9VIBR|nr:oxidative stress defense protein [Vibrio viridaestus]MDC0611136.1 oxidative stress defense protein [Vibrio sp.]RQW62877.1 oxidative stress defense protein [Vibrio viridaestus]
MRLVSGSISVLCIFFASLAYSQSLPFAHIATTGYGEVSVVPDSATFSVQVEKTMMNADQAKESVDDVVSNFLAQLYKMGVEKDDINSSNLYLAPQYYYPKDSQAQLVGYKARRKITIDVKNLDKLNDYIDTAIDSGINRVENIQLTVKDNEKYLEQARLLAIEDANQKALSLAKGFKRSLGAVWQVSYRNNQSSPVLIRTLSSESKIVNDSYQDSNIVVKDSVDVVYKLN